MAARKGFDNSGMQELNSRLQLRREEAAVTTKGCAH